MSESAGSDGTDKPDEAAPKAKRGARAKGNIVVAGENGEVLEFAAGDKVPAWLVDQINADGRAEKLLV